MNFKKMFRKNVTFDNLKSPKNWALPFFKKMHFWQSHREEVKLTLPSLCRIDFKKEKILIIIPYSNKLIDALKILHLKYPPTSKIISNRNVSFRSEINLNNECY